MPLETNLRALYFRHKRKLFLIPIICLLGGVLTILFYPRTYQSQAKLFLQVGRESIGLDPTATTGQMVSMLHSGREDEVTSAMEILRSRGVSEKVLDELGAEVILGEDEASNSKSRGIGSAVFSAVGSMIGAMTSLDPISEREEAILEIEKNLDVFADRKSAVIGITYRAKSPHLAQKVLQTIVKIYPQEYLRVHRNGQSHEFFSEQEELLRTQLDAAAGNLRDAKNQMGLASIEERSSLLEQQLHAINLEKLHSDQEVATATARIADLRLQLDRTPEQLVESLKTIPNEGADLLRNQLYSLQVQQQDLLSRYTEEHPLVVAIASQVEEAAKVVNDQVEKREESTQQINPIYRQLSLELKQEESRLAGLKSRLDALTKQQQETHDELKELNGFAVRLDELTREEQLRRSKYMQYSESLEQARIDGQLAEARISNVSIAQAATLSERPVNPRKSLVALASIMLALAGTASAVMVSERLYPSTTQSSDQTGPTQPQNGQLHETAERFRSLQPS